MYKYKIIFEDDSVKHGETKSPHNILAKFVGGFKRIKKFSCTINFDEDATVDKSAISCDDISKMTQKELLESWRKIRNEF